MDGIFHQGLVLWGIPARRVDHAVIMACEVLEAPVYIRLIFTGPAYRGLQIVRHDRLGHAPIKMQGVFTATDQVPAFLAPTGLHIGILAVGEYRHEYLDRDQFPRIPVHDMQSLARI